jgi:hypothetical protein
MRYLLLPLIAAVGCTGSSNLCAQVKCKPGKVCNPLNGVCEAGDGGTGGGGGGAGGGGGTAGGAAAGGTGGGGGLTCTPACPSYQHCDSSSGQCVQCVTSADCACPTTECVSHICRTPVPSDAGTVVTPPAGESCAAAQPFSFSGCTLPRSISFSVDLSGHSDDEQGVCSAAGGKGRDLVYVLRLDAMPLGNTDGGLDTFDLDVTVTPSPGSTAEPVVYVRRMPCTGQELACVDSGGPVGAEVHLRSRPVGDYAIFLDTYDAASAGAVDVTLTLSSPTLPPNDTCLSADPIATDGGRVRADLSIAANDEVTSCNGMGDNSLDLAWRFDVPVTSDVVARAVSVDGGASPVIELRAGSCAAGHVKACALASAQGLASLRARSVSAGTYYLIVEAWDSGVAGPVDVSVSVEQPSPPLQFDTCMAPRDIVFADGGTFTEWDIDTSSANDDEVGTCNDPKTTGVGGPEYVYHLRLNDPRFVVITAGATGTVAVTTDAGTEYVRGASDADPVIYLRSGTCEGPELSNGCSDDPNDSAAIEVLSSGMNRLSVGDYYLFVESYGTSVGLTHVTVSATP